MRTQNHSERAALLRARGGARAGAFWLARRIFRLDVYRFYATALAGVEPDSCPPFPVGYRLLVLRSLSDMAACGQYLVAQIDKQSGCGVAEVIRANGRIYAIVCDRQVVSQLRIDPGVARVDTPLNMSLGCGENSAFLSFLYTDPAYRQGGWGAGLVSRVCAELAREGKRVCVCHVQATNIRSINTFARAGWIPIAWLFATVGGRLLGVRRSRRSGVSLDVAVI